MDPFHSEPSDVVSWSSCLVRGPMYVLNIPVSREHKYLPGAILPSGRYIPPAKTDDSNDGCHHNTIIHICCSDWSRWRKEEDHTDEEDPYNGDKVDSWSPFAQGIWPFHESNTMLINSPRCYDGDVAEVQRWSGDCEYRVDCLSGAESNKIEANTESNH